MIRAFLNMILVQPLDGESETDSGLILPPGYDEKLRRGMIVSVGETVPYLKAGQVVYFQDDCSLVLKDTLVVNGSCVVAVEEEED